MFCDRKSTQMDIVLGGVTLSSVATHKHLGIVYNRELNWSDHIDQVVKKVSKKLGLLFTARYKLRRSALIQVYKSMILPIIEYGSLIYDNASQSDLNRLDSLHRRAGIICTGAISRSRTSRLFEDLGWCSLQIRRSNAKLALMYKIVSNLAPSYLVSLLQTLQRTNSSTALRQRRKFAVFCRQNRFYRSFFPSALRLWEDLTEAERNSDSFQSFKTALQLKSMADIPCQYSVYNTLYGTYSKILTQIRLGLSNLNEHLYSYNLSDNPFCPNCLHVVETTSHNLVVCPPYKTAREKLFLSLQGILKDHFRVDIGLH